MVGGRAIRERGSEKSQVEDLFNELALYQEELGFLKLFLTHNERVKEQ
jgi:hypothetical protein